MWKTNKRQRETDRYRQREKEGQKETEREGDERKERERRLIVLDIIKQ